MNATRIYWNRFQTREDKNLNFLCGQLKRAGLIHSKFVDRFHLTNILSSSGSNPIPITGIDDLVDVFQPAILTKVNSIIRQHFPELLEGETEQNEQNDAVAAPAVDGLSAVEAAATAPTANTSEPADENDMDTHENAIQPATSGQIIDIP